MGIDASIYSNIQNPAASAPSVIDAAEKGMKLSALGMQQAQQGYQMQTQNALRGAYAKNTDPQTGQLNRAGFLSDLGKVAPQSVGEFQSQFAQQDKQAAEAKTAQMQAHHQTVSAGLPYLNYALNGVPKDQIANVWPQLRKEMADRGLNVQNLPEQWDAGPVKQSLALGSQYKEALENQMLATNIAAKPAELNATLYGSRSPNAELTSQYDKQVQSIRGSQNAMAQMMDNYHHPSPQGDASLLLNAFKIKFPNAPDVGSLEELRSSQSTPDKWKNFANQVLKGGLDQSTRDNLMRDGVSTFRANVSSLRGVQQRFQARGQQQNVNDPTMTYEPAIEKTFAEANALQDKIGAYVPPTERGGIGGTVSKVVANVLGVGKDQNESGGGIPGISSANASERKPASAAPSPGDTQALQWLKTVDASDPMAFKVRAKLKAKGLI